MSYARFENFLKDAIGLDTPSIGHKAVAQAVLRRATVVCEGDIDAYWNTLCENAVERQALVECIVVPETWFFRDAAAFDAAAACVRERALTLGAGNKLRVLSAPCSTGEEAYSLAMTLLDAGLQPSQFGIDAIDVSQQALSAAQAGVYRKNSFRAQDLSFRDRFFERVPGGHQVRDVLKQSINFRRGNLLAPEPGVLGRYDVVFCRNLLIYFDRDTQDRAVTALGALLAEGGRLFVGPSETGIFMHHGFAPIGWKGAFAFERVPQRVAARAAARATSRSRPTRPTARTAARSTQRPAFTRAIAPFAPAASATSLAPGPVGDEATGFAGSGALSNLLEAAEQLANEGQLEAAKARCAEAMRQRPADENAIFLMGVLEDALGNVPAAIDHFRRVLYLQPNMQAAMAHLAVLLERTGDIAGAERLRARAHRAARRMEPAT
jgi:chemotaxis protein methyltransferase WspC